MKQLVIKGHATRGKEIINLLEMLGANRLGYNDTFTGFYYYIECGAIRSSDEYPMYATVFTLEEFLEKCPFKVGDKVKNIYGAYGKVYEIKWIDDEIQYRLDFGHHTSGWYSVYELQPYKEEVSIEDNKCTQCVYAVNNNHCGLRGFRSNFNVNYCSAQNVDKLPNGFELQEDGYFSWVNKNPEYPSTYLKCCSILQINNSFSLIYKNVDNKYITSYEYQLMLDMNKLRKLKVCRDAYWKIAGEQMGLGKTWYPQFENCNIPHYCIFINHTGEICNDCFYGSRCLLAFPTAEMCDAFYDNFKDLIEECKELL